MRTTAEQPRVWLFSDAAYVGGAELYLESILRGAPQQAAGLLCLQRPGTQSWLDRLERDGVRVERLVASDAWQARWQLARAVRRLRVQLLHVNLPGPYDALLATAPWIAKLAGARHVVVTEHLPGVGRVGKRYWLKRFGVRSVDRAIALCELHRRLLETNFGYPGTRVVVIANGVDDHGGVEGRSELPAQSGVSLTDASALRLLQLGALEERKGGAELIRALALLTASAPRIELIFVGEGTERAAWAELAQQLGLGARVHFAGQRDDARRWLAAADIVVLASRREGMPLSLLEAMEVGRPIVASAVDGVPELLSEEAGLLVPENHPAALSQAIGRLAEHAELRRRLGQRARQRFLHLYRREEMLRRTWALYEALA